MRILIGLAARADARFAEPSSRPRRFGLVMAGSTAGMRETESPLSVILSPEGAVDLFHGYTYSAHPLACAAASAVLDIYQDENLFERSAELSPYWEDGVHSLKGLPGVLDIRNLGLAAGIDLAATGPVGTRGYNAFVKAFELGLMVRQSGDAIAMSPPLVIEKVQIDEIIDLVGKTIKATA